MKKNPILKKILILSLVFVCTAINAQIHWNVRAGIGASNLLGLGAGDSRLTYQDGGVGIFSFKVGVGIDIPLVRQWSLQPTLYYSTKGTKLSAFYGGEQIYEGYLRHQLHYLELPVFAVYKLQLTSSTSLLFRVGPYIGYGLVGKVTVATPMYNDFHETFKENLFTDGCHYDDITYINNERIQSEPFNRIDAGIATGVEFNVHHMLFGVEASFGLTPVSSNMLNKKPKNVTAYLMVGYQF